MSAEDEARAAAFRDMLAAREAVKKERERALAGDTAAKLALAEKYRPLTSYHPDGVPFAWEGDPGDAEP